MTLKQETRDSIKGELSRRMEKIPAALGFDAYGITAEVMGLNDTFLDRVIDEAYLGIFTVAELEDMEAFHKRFSDRAIILEKVVEEAVSKVIEANKDVIIAKLGGE